jgi:hypothetical protein
LKAVKKEMNWYLSSAQNTKSATSFYGGGYSPEIKTIEAHNTYRAAKDIYSKKMHEPLNSNPCNYCIFI